MNIEKTVGLYLVKRATKNKHLTQLDELSDLTALRVHYINEKDLFKIWLEEINITKSVLFVFDRTRYLNKGYSRHIPKSNKIIFHCP